MTLVEDRHGLLKIYTQHTKGNKQKHVNSGEVESFSYQLKL